MHPAHADPDVPLDDVRAGWWSLDASDARMPPLHLPPSRLFLRSEPSCVAHYTCRADGAELFGRFQGENEPTLFRAKDGCTIDGADHGHNVPLDGQDVDNWSATSM